MFNLIARKMFGSRNERVLKKLRPLVAAINALEPEMIALDDAGLRAKTDEFKQRLADGATLDSLLPEAFAVVRETAKRVLGERHYDVQLLGGMVLHDGKIPEMRTGEGKTLVATAPVYLNALTGKGVHVVTVNDYLAKRDAEWMGQVYRFLGLTVGVIQNGLSDDERRAAYACDITYSTNNELGFDYLRDNMKYRAEEIVQRPFNYATIDEVDSILIDESRTPLIISGPAEDGTALYISVDEVIRKLIADEENFEVVDKTPSGAVMNDGVAAIQKMRGAGGGNPGYASAYIEVDEKTKSVLLTDAGGEKVEELLREAGLLIEGSLYDTPNMPLLHHANVALRAHKAYARDKEYIVKEGKIVLIDEFTGRMMAGRRFSDGLHQALEAKEKVQVQRENQTLASITFQNFFRMYPKISGMTGTALTEAGEFAEIYNLDVVEIPTHRAVARLDMDDDIFRTEKEKLGAIVALVKEAHARKQPILVGTTSIEKSETLSELFRKERIPHNVLNARHHEQEAQIVAQAGRPGAVMVATNMAGRGTDIKLGGNVDMLVQAQLKGEETEEQIAQLRVKMKEQIARDKDTVINAGGLFVIGTERHESRRIDNQLRGRSGRQGDPGASKFFISLEDDLMRIFGAERIDAVLVRLGIQEGQAIAHPWISTAIERAQKKVEAQHFDIRRNLLRFDNVMNDQRKVVYGQRRELMGAENLSDQVADMIEEVTLVTLERYIPADTYKEKWDLAGLAGALKKLCGRDIPVEAWAEEEGIGEQELADKTLEFMNEHWANKQKSFIDSIHQHPTMFGLAENSDAAHREEFGRLVFADMERGVVMQMLDKAWKEHLLNLDHLRQGINLRGYAQRDPLNEYKAEAFALFQSMMDDYRADVAHTVLNLSIATSDDIRQLQEKQQPKKVEMKETRNDPAFDAGDANVVGFDRGKQGFRADTVQKPVFDANNPETWAHTPRNNPCPCGSGKKYKHCHGSVSAALRAK